MPVISRQYHAKSTQFPIPATKKKILGPEANSMAAYCHGRLLQQLMAVLKPELFGA